MDMTGATEYILTAAQSLVSQDYHRKSRMDNTWVRWCIILRKGASIDKMDYHMFRRKYLLGFLEKLGEVLKQQ